MAKNETGFTLYRSSGDIITFQQGIPIIGKLGIVKNPFNPQGKKNKPINVLSIDNKPCPEHYALNMLANDIESGKIKPGTIGRITFEKVDINPKTNKVKFVHYKIELKNA